MGIKANFTDLTLLKSGCISIHFHTQSKPSRSYVYILYKDSFKPFCKFYSKDKGVMPMR